MNDRAAAVFGYRPDELVGQSWDVVFAESKRALEAGRDELFDPGERSLHK